MALVEIPEDILDEVNEIVSDDGYFLDDVLDIIQGMFFHCDKCNIDFEHDEVCFNGDSIVCEDCGSPLLVYEH